MNRREILGTSLLAGLGGLLPSGPCSAQSNNSWRPLFDGRSLEGWTFFQEGIGTVDKHHVVEIDDGVLHLLGPGYAADDAPPGRVTTILAWSDYHLRLDYRYGQSRWAPRKLQRRNSGILYHMSPENGRLFPDCIEFQLEEGDVGDALMVNTLGVQGPSLGGTPLWPNWLPAFPYDYQQPVEAGGVRRQWYRHSGEYERMDDWNTVDLYAVGDQAAHLVNGRIVATLFKLLKRNANGMSVPLTGGRIALEFEWAEIMFRNVMIRPLDASAIASIRAQGSD